MTKNEIREQIANPYPKPTKPMSVDSNEGYAWLAFEQGKSAVFSTPIAQVTCPECKGSGKKPTGEMPGCCGYEPCFKCGCTGKVPFTVGDAIDKAIEELE